MKKSFFILLMFAFNIVICSAQTEFTVPNNPVLTSKEDYKSFEPIMVQAAKWLEETPLENNPEKRKEANAFVLQWVSGSPNVSISVTTKLMDYFKKNPDLMIVYFASFSKNVIENPTSFTQNTAAKAGLSSVLACYEKSKAKKEPALEKLKKDKANIDTYVTQVLTE